MAGFTMKRIKLHRKITISLQAAESVQSTILLGLRLGFVQVHFRPNRPAVATTAKAKIGGDLRLKARMAKLGFAVVFSSDQGDFVHARQMATGGVDSANTSCHMFWRAFDFKLIEVL